MAGPQGRRIRLHDGAVARRSEEPLADTEVSRSTAWSARSTCSTSSSPIAAASSRVLEDLLLNQQARADEVHPEGRPVTAGYISSRFGGRTDPFTGRRAFHKGVDFAGRAGAEVVAVASGVVIWSGQRYGYGELVEVNHGNGYVTRYAHNADNLVAVGDTVRRGQSHRARWATRGRATGPEPALRGAAERPARRPADLHRPVSSRAAAALGATASFPPISIPRQRATGAQNRSRSLE